MLFTVVTVVCWPVRCQHNKTRNIYLLTVLPYPNPIPDLHPSWSGGDDVRPALELAEDQINRNSSLLPNHTLHLVHVDGGCQRVTTLVVSFMEKAFQKERVTGIVGPGCSISTFFLGSLTNETKLSLVNVHGGGSPTLADRTLYPYMLGTLGSTDNYVEALLYLMREAAWEKVAVLYDDSRVYFTNTKRLLVNMTSVSFLFPVSNISIPLRAIQDQGLRVTFVLCPLYLARQILCLAYNKSMIYGNYQWVFMDRIFDEMIQPIEFVYDRVPYNCSMDNMKDVLKNALLMSYKLTPFNDSGIISNITHDDYLEYYEQYRKRYNSQPPRFNGQKNSSYTRWATYFYDAVWAWALVLDNLMNQSSSFEIGSEYGNKNQAKKILDQFYQTKFNGMSGEISFDNNTGFVDRPVNIKQVSKSGRLIAVALVTATETINTGPIFKRIPDAFQNITVRASKGMGIIFAIIVPIQFSITVTFHILTVLHHKKPSIKAASPKLLHISYIGVYIVATGLFIQILFTAAQMTQDVRPYICQMLWGWCFPVGFILSFVPVAMRTWRIYRIFKHYLNPGPFISNRVLIGGTMLALLLILILSVIWTIIDPFTLETQEKFILYDHDSDIITRQITHQCNCKYYFYWLAIIMSYVLSILILVSIFSLLTGNIPNKTFTTDSLRVFCYIMTALFVVGFPLFYIFSFTSFHPNYSSTTLYTLINLMMAAYILCQFLPPLLPIFKSYRNGVIGKLDVYVYKKNPSIQQ